VVLALSAHATFAGTTERVSVSSAGEQTNDWSLLGAVSADGRFMAFECPASNLVPGDTNGAWDVFVHDRTTGATERVSVSSDGEQANALSGYHKIAISADGRFVAFDSPATNLVAGDTNSGWDVFVHDRATGATERVSVNSDGEEADGRPSFAAGTSKDGRFLAPTPLPPTWYPETPTTSTMSSCETEDG
jgi:hypothetical protein